VVFCGFLAVAELIKAIFAHQLPSFRELGWLAH
jgi:hypothetical protein